MTKTIEQLESQSWDEPPEFDSNVVKTSYRLRKKPIDQFDVEDLRFMIGQNFGTQYLMPRALGLLEQNPLVEDHHYPGELLQAVFELPEEYWSDHPAQLGRAVSIANKALSELDRRCAEAKAEAERLYHAKLDEEQCLSLAERNVRTWSERFLDRNRDT